MPERDRPPEAELPRYYDTREDDAVRALRAERNGARGRWMASQLALDAAMRRGDDELAAETHGGWLGALHEWQRAEAALVAARLGFRSTPLAPRRQTPGPEER